MESNPEGLELLKTINFKGLEAAADQDWDDVRALEVRLLQHMLQ
jgi:phosphonate transport system substrate-binding protein